MNSRLANINWNKIEELSEEDISYFMFLEDKSVDVIAKIRHMKREEVQQHIIKGKLKYGILAKCRNEEELFQCLSKISKESRIKAFESFNSTQIDKLGQYIIENYSNMNFFEKEKAIWIIGELKLKNAINILIKATVHDNITIKRLSVSALGKLKCEEGEMALIRALGDNNSQVVSYAISSLIKINSAKCKDRIIEILNSNPKAYVKIKCEEYLQGEIN